MSFLRSLRGLAPRSLALLSLVACNEFDDSLEKQIVATPPGDNDAGVDAGSSALALTDRCSSGALPIAQSGSEPLMVGVTGLTSNVAEGGQCSIAGAVLDKAEGFFTVTATAGERWHFHLDAAPGQNLAVLASPTCDLRECIAAADTCGPGEPEHFTFVAKTSGSYVVVVEGIDPQVAKGAPLNLLVIHPTCGDGVKEHSEVCDDNNVTSGDGCDSVCRLELSDDQSDELEPNDDSYGANVLAPEGAAEPMRIAGKIGGACQPDFYMLRVETPSVLELSVLTGSRAACSNAPELELTLLGADRDELRATVEFARKLGRGGACPALSTDLGPGTYFARLSRVGNAPQFDYELDVTLTPKP